jgi:hypothetical protein
MRTYGHDPATAHPRMYRPARADHGREFWHKHEFPELQVPPRFRRPMYSTPRVLRRKFAPNLSSCYFRSTAASATALASARAVW